MPDKTDVAGNGRKRSREASRPKCDRMVSENDKAEQNETAISPLQTSLQCRPKEKSGGLISVLVRCWSAYLDALDKRPLQTKIYSASSCGVISECIVNKIAADGY